MLTFADMGGGEMDDNGKFIQQKDSRSDAWKNVAKSDRQIRRYAGDAFAETRLDDGLHAIVDKDSTSEEKKLSRQQRTMGAVAHLSLQAMENYSSLYKKVDDLFMWYIGQPSVVNPEWTGEDDTVHSQYVFSEGQNRAYEHFQNIQR